MDRIVTSLQCGNYLHPLDHLNIRWYCFLCVWLLLPLVFFFSTALCFISLALIRFVISSYFCCWCFFLVNFARQCYVHSLQYTRKRTAMRKSNKTKIRVIISNEYSVVVKKRGHKHSKFVNDHHHVIHFDTENNDQIHHTHSIQEGNFPALNS